MSRRTAGLDPWEGWVGCDIFVDAAATRYKPEWRRSNEAIIANSISARTRWSNWQISPRSLYDTQLAQRTTIMSDYKAAIQEEYEVLESIFPDELKKISEDKLQIDVIPEEGQIDSNLKVILGIDYTTNYPDEVPNLSLEPEEGELDEEELESLINGMKAVGEENLGMAMVFTLVTHLREALVEVIQKRIEKEKQLESEKERQLMEAEAARTRGTPVTVVSFSEWRTKFMAEMKEKQDREDDEKLKGLTPKERDEWKKSKSKPTGRQLFEKNRDLATSDANYIEEGVTSVDITQYDRTAARDEEEDDTGLHFSDSD
ncbi:RWD protein, partial [Rhizoctonia solani]